MVAATAGPPIERNRCASIAPAAACASFPMHIINGLDTEPPGGDGSTRCGIFRCHRSITGHVEVAATDPVPAAGGDERVAAGRRGRPTGRVLDPKEGVRHDVVGIVGSNQNPRESHGRRAERVPPILDRRLDIEAIGWTLCHRSHLTMTTPPTPSAVRPPTNKIEKPPTRPELTPSTPLYPPDRSEQR